jgi:hypothetical protein
MVPAEFAPLSPLDTVVAVLLGANALAAVTELVGRWNERRLLQELKSDPFSVSISTLDASNSF